MQQSEGRSGPRPYIVGKWAYSITEGGEVDAGRIPIPPDRSQISTANSAAASGAVNFIASQNRNVFDFTFPTDVEQRGTVWFQDDYFVTTLTNLFIPEEAFEWTLDPSGVVKPLAEMITSRIKFTKAKIMFRVTGVVKLVEKFTPRLRVRCLPADGMLYASRRCQVTLFTPSASMGTFCAAEEHEGTSDSQPDSFEFLQP